MTTPNNSSADLKGLSTVVRWSSSSFDCNHPNSGSASLNCHSNADPLFTTYVPWVRCAYRFMIVCRERKKAKANERVGWDHRLSTLAYIYYYVRKLRTES